MTTAWRVEEGGHDICVEDTWHKPWEVLAIACQELRREQEMTVEHLGTSPLPTKYGNFNFAGFGDKTLGKEHTAFWMGDISGEDVLCRVHRSCVTSEIGGAINCDCPEQVQEAMKEIAKEGRGVLVYLQDEGRGNGLRGKIAQLNGMFKWNGDEIEHVTDTVTAFEAAGYAGERGDYTAAVDILRFLGVRSVRLMTNNPEKIKALDEAGIPVIHRSHIMENVSEITRKDLQAKKDRLGHIL